MNTTIFHPIAARPAPVKTEGFIPWIRNNLFHDLPTTVGTLLIGSILIYFFAPTDPLGVSHFSLATRLKSLQCGGYWGLLGGD